MDILDPKKDVTLIQPHKNDYADNFETLLCDLLEVPLIMITDVTHGQGRLFIWQSEFNIGRVSTEKV